MTTRPVLHLPHDPDLEQLRRQARDLQRGGRAGDPAAVELLTSYGVAPDVVRRADAQRVLARAYGFASWPRLVHHLTEVGALSRGPDRVEASDDPATEFLRLACLAYGSDDPGDPVRAAAMLADDPSLGTADAYTAAATADAGALTRLLADDPGVVRREGGPFGWVPLLYLAYARHDPTLSRDRVLAATDVLLAAGADPDAGYLWHGLETPFTALTGALGGGEGDQPAHPQGLALARRLLEAGADPHDGQGLYNRMFDPSDDHLELLLEFGLGSGDGGPWRRRFPGLPAPAALLRAQLRWAVDHGLVARVRLLAEHGVDVRSPFTEPSYGEREPVLRTPAELAYLRGDLELVGVLMSLGADGFEMGPVDSLVSAVLRGDHRHARHVLRGDGWEARGVAQDDEAVLAAAQAARPGLVVQAAAAGRVDAVRLAADLGWDVDAKGRSDTPSDQPWETGLHAAVSHGHADVVTVLLGLGADPELRDRRFDATPYGWAVHLGRPDLAALLPPDPPEDSPAGR